MLPRKSRILVERLPMESAALGATMTPLMFTLPRKVTTLGGCTSSTPVMVVSEANVGLVLGGMMALFSTVPPAYTLVAKALMLLTSIVGNSGAITPLWM